jgi:hypothetical protein
MVGDGVAVAKTYSVTVRHIALVKELAESLSKRENRRISEGEIIRKAIDLLAEQVKTTQTENIQLN